MDQVARYRQPLLPVAVAVLVGAVAVAGSIVVA